MAHSTYKEGDILQIYFCVIFLETRHHIQAHITSGALCPFFGREKKTDGSTLRLMILLASAIMVTLESQNIFFGPTLGLPTNLGVGRFWLSPSNSSSEGA